MNGRAPFWIRPGDSNLTFPDTSRALSEPDGLLAIGGDLEPQRLLSAYCQGVFPWYSDGQPILWWSPDPRSVLLPGHLHISRSLRKTLRQGYFSVTFDRAFDAVIKACAQARPGSSGTWITREMANAYTRLHLLGFAHSVECWRDGQLAGGLYGIAIGQVFFGESMFSLEANASKVAFSHLVRQLQAWDFQLIDCQVYSPHLASLGAGEIPRADFVTLLDKYCGSAGNSPTWAFDAADCRQWW